MKHFGVSSLVAASIGAAHAFRRDLTNSTAPVVTLAQGIYQGNQTVTGNNTIDVFKGIRYAKALDASYRFKKPDPVEVSNSTEVVNATEFGAACPQSAMGIPGGSSAANYAEDCLFANVFRPAGTVEGDNLPVLYWIYGGAFEGGSSNSYPGDSLVSTSVDVGTKIVIVTVNYRINAWGFLAGEEMLAAQQNGTANLNAGLEDQRQGLRWVQDNIAEFGGDPSRVTLWGESAGSQSVGAQIVANGGDTEGLFVGAIMESGSPMTGVGLDADNWRYTQTFDQIVENAGCSNSTDKIGCLRSLDFETLDNAIDPVRSSSAPVLGNNIFGPTNDYGYWFSERPSALQKQGKVANVAILSGDNHDEGSVFAGNTFQAYIKNETSFKSWFTTQALVNDSAANGAAVMDKIYELYPDVPEVGCPYFQLPTNTSGGFTNTSFRWFEPYDTNQFKRAGALWSDWNFQAPRRHLLTNLVRARNASNSSAPGIWSFSWDQISTNVSASDAWQAASHGSELAYFFCTLGEVCSSNQGEVLSGYDLDLYNLMRHAWISFAAYQDPTTIDNLEWPQYGDESYQLQLKGGNTTVIQDVYRSDAMAYLTSDEAIPVLGY